MSESSIRILTFTSMLVAFTCASTQAGRALAQSSAGPELTLKWEAPPECPSSDRVLAATWQLLGGPRSSGGEVWDARATVTRGDDWSIAIETRSASGVHRRSLHAQTCQGLADATALILALAVNPNAMRMAPAAPPAPVVAAPLPASRQGSRQSLHFSVSAPLALTAGPLPLPDYAVGIALSARFDPVFVEIALHDWLRQETATVAGSSVGGTFGFVSGTLYACRTLHAGSFDVGPCALLDVGRIEATGIQVAHSATATPLWLAMGLGAFGSLELDAGGKWHIPIHVDFSTPLMRHDFVIRDVATPVYRQPTVAGQLATGLEFRFW